MKQTLLSVVETTLRVALWVCLCAVAGKATHDFYRYADRSIYVAVDDSEANIAYSLANGGRYGFPASPVLTGLPRTDGQFNYGPWYFYLAGALVWIFGFSLTVVRSIHLWIILGSILAVAWWLRGRERAAPTALYGLGIIYSFEVSQWPMARPDSLVSAFAIALIIFAGLGTLRVRPAYWFGAGLAAACAALTHLIAASLVPSAALLFALASWADMDAGDRRAWRLRVSRSAAVFAAGVGLGVAMFYASFGFAIGRQVQFIEAYRGLTKSSDDFATAIGHHLAYAFGYLSTEMRYAVAITFVMAWALVACATRLRDDTRRLVRAYVVPPLVLWSAYLVSNGWYTSYHAGYGVLHSVLFYWTAAMLLWVLLHSAGRESRRRLIFATVAVAVLLVQSGRQLYWQFAADSDRTRRMAAWVPFSAYSAEVLQPIPARATAWGSVLFGLESPDRIQVVNWVDAVWLFPRVDPTERAALTPDFVLWGYPEVRDQMLMGTRFNDTLLAKLAALLPDAQWRVVSLVVGAPYGVTRTYARHLRTDGSSERPPNVRVYDPEHNQWLSRIGPPVPVTFAHVTPIDLRLGYEPIPPARRATTTVAATLPPGRYLLKVAVKPGAGFTQQRLLAATSASMLRQTMGELGPEGDFVAYLGDDTYIFMAAVHPGGTLYVSQFDGGTAPDIASVEAHPIIGLLDSSESPLREQPLPELTKWNATPGVKATIDHNALRLEGDGTSSGYQLLSPLIRAREPDEVTIRVPINVERGHVCPGVLNATGLTWLVVPDRPRAELKFRADATPGFRVVIANCNWKGETADSRFAVAPGTYLVDPAGLYSDRLVDMALQPEVAKANQLAGLTVKTFPEGLAVRQFTIDAPVESIGANDFIYRADIVRHNSPGWTIKGKAQSKYAYLMRAKGRRLNSDSRLLVAGHIEKGGLSIGLLKDDKWAAQVNVTEPGDFTVVIAPPGSGTYSLLIANNLPESLETSIVLTKFGMVPK
jgi:hypothetical protein